MIIERQDLTTEIHELVGAPIDKFWGVGVSCEAGLIVLYLESNSFWNRFFVEAGILFWANYAPDPEEDLTDNERYIDLLEDFGIPKGSRIERISMADGMLTLWANGGSVKVTEDSETSCQMIALS